MNKMCYILEGCCIWKFYNDAVLHRCQWWMLGTRGGQKSSRFKSGPDYLEKSVQIFFWSRLKSGFCLEKIHFFHPDSSRLNPDKNLEIVWTRWKPDFCLDFNWTNLGTENYRPTYKWTRKWTRKSFSMKRYLIRRKLISIIIFYFFLADQ